MASPSRPSMDSSCLSPILSPTASVTDLTTPYPPTRSPSGRPGGGRRTSTAGSVVSLTSSVGTALDWRASKDYGNGGGGGTGSLVGGPNSTAISALVESHGARTTGASRPRPGDIPPVTLTQIPKIKPSAFASYLSLAPEYDQYQRAKDRGLEEHLRLSKTTEGTLSPVPSIAEQTVIADDASSIKSVKRRRPNLAVAPLQTVPRVYFDENFRLENPRTFDVVSERSEVIRSTVPASQGENGAVAQAAPSQRKALATNAILQEKLSWYMDTVEVHLISSISTASSSFFAALGDLRELHSEASASVHKIQALRKELVRLDEEQAVKGLEIVRLRRRRDNVAKLERAVKQIEQVTLGVQHAEKSLEHHEIETALDAIVETERLLAGEGEGLVDLRGVRSLEAVMADLNHLRHRIGKAYEARFVQCLLDDLRFHVERVPSSETLRRFAQSFQREQYQRFLTSQQRTNFFPPPRSSSLPPEFAVLSDSLRNLLKQYLDGLQRANHINDAVQAYRDAVIKEAKNLIRRNLPSEGDADSVASNISHISRMSRSGGIRQSSADKSQALTRALRALGPADAEDLLVKIYTGVSELIRRLGSQQKMLLDVTMQMGETGVGGMLSPRLEQNGFQNDFPGEMQRSRSESDPTISMDISDLISSAVDISQSHIVKLVKVRTEQVAHYPPDMFLRYFTLTRLFAQECEAVSVRVGPGLQNAVSNQIRDFLSAYQDDRIRNLAECLENDKWAAKEFEPERQQSLDRILKAATADPEEWVGIGRLWEIRAREQGETIKLPPPPSETDDVPLNGTAAQTMAEPPKRLTHALVDDQKFILPESGLLVLTEIESYLRLVVNMPGVTQELGSNILQFLQLFNSRTFQLILGAGATRSAGLRSITTKHLAMASQALSIITTIIPYIRETLRRHSSSPNLVADFDKLKRTTQEYQDEIHGKLISIMSDRARTHVATMRGMNWDEAWVGEDSKYYMDILCRETGILYKVLNKHLPVAEVRGIMGPVFQDYADKLVDGVAGAVVRTDEGKKRMARDAETFRTKLAGLEGCGNAGEIVMDAVRNKTLSPAATEANGSSRAGTPLVRNAPRNPLMNGN